VYKAYILPTDSQRLVAGVYRYVRSGDKIMGLILEMNLGHQIH